MSEIVNVGICTVDAIGQTIDSYPPPGGLRLFDKLTMTTGGNAVNCSIALGKMGIRCDVVVKVGEDALGEFVVGECRKYGVNTEGVIRSAGVHTPYTFVCVMPGGQRWRRTMMRRCLRRSGGSSRRAPASAGTSGSVWARG